MKKTIAILSSASFTLATLLATTAQAQQSTLFYDPPPPSSATLVQPGPAQWPAPLPGEQPKPEEAWTRLGEQGEVVFSGASSLGASSTSYAGSQASSWGVSISPGVDWFVVKNLSIGLDVGASFGSSTSYSSSGSLVDHPYSDIVAGPRIGVVLPLSRHWSLWPRASFVYELARDGFQAQDGSVPPVHDGSHGFRLYGYAPIVFQPVSNFFLGFGPSVSVPIAQSEDYSTREYINLSYGAGFVLGGFVGGEPTRDASAAQAAASAARQRSFGDQGEWVLTGSFGVGGNHSSDDTSHWSSTSVGVEPGFDYFVADDVSVGVDTGIGTYSENGIDAAPYSRSYTSFSVGSRLGYNVRLGSAASLWLRATVGGSIISNGATFTYAEPGSGPSSVSLSWTDSVAWASLGAPLLVHVAPHAFVGFGPTLYHELSRSSSGPGLTGPETTTVGGSLIVGGWL